MIFVRSLREKNDGLSARHFSLSAPRAQIASKGTSGQFLAVLSVSFSQSEAVHRSAWPKPTRYGAVAVKRVSLRCP
ncbi:hypothetical protein SCALM49S_02191 [Streptomyces californicus]